MQFTKHALTHRSASLPATCLHCYTMLLKAFGLEFKHIIFDQFESGEPPQNSYQAKFLIDTKKFLGTIAGKIQIRGLTQIPAHTPFSRRGQLLVS